MKRPATIAPPLTVVGQDGLNSKAAGEGLSDTWWAVRPWCGLGGRVLSRSGYVIMSINSKVCDVTSLLNLGLSEIP